MTIGIITFWQTLDNYGQVLQAYALQNILREMGHSPYIIRYDIETRAYPVSKLKQLLRVLFFPLYLKRKRDKDKKKKMKKQKESIRHFDDFRNTYFTFSDKIYNTLEQLRADPPSADIYMAGSDQIWGYLLSSPENKVFFLDFGKKETKRISYAASFGMKEYPAQLKDKLRIALKSFNSVSCREYDGINICQSVDVKAQKVLDPTLIAPLSIYENLIETPRKSENYIFIYSLNIKEPEELRWEELKKISIDRRYNIKVTVGSGYCEGMEIYDGVEYSYATIEQWLSNIKYAQLVVTTSFHGIVFCILLHRSFAYVPLQGEFSKGNNRVLDLLKDLELQGRVLDKSSAYEQLLTEPINWDKTDQLLEIQREASFSFLNKSLIKN